MAWRESGLQPPQSVADATETYRQKNDPVGQFIEECCDEDPDSRCSSKDLYDHFLIWSARNVSVVLAQSEFGKVLARKGFENKKIGGNAGWKGIKVKLAVKASSQAVSYK